MYNISYTGSFKKDYKRCIKRNYNLTLLQKAIEILVETGNLPTNYKPHKLSGDYSDCWECHIQVDWLMIWLQNEEERELTLIRTGTHADLF